MPWIAEAAALIFAGLGGLHLLYTLHDFVRPPRYFRPRDASLLDAMRRTKTSIAPQGRDYWSALLGFHLSHSIGVLLFALLIVIADLYPIGWLQPLLLVICAAYAAIAWRCWFHIPLIGALAATTLLVVSWLV